MLIDLDAIERLQAEKELTNAQVAEAAGRTRRWFDLVKAQLRARPLYDVNPKTAQAIARGLKTSVGRIQRGRSEAAA
jgi:hypothetical protein